jgi:methionyl-tRNA formyltransferase
LRLVFAGTPAFAAQSLQALLNSAPSLGAEVIAVFTQPDRPAGRGQQLQASAVKALALQHGIAVEQPASLKTPDGQALLAKYPCDLMIVAAYGLLLPQAVLDFPRLGCVNVHGSLLPRWRGAAPIVRAIEAGDSQTGIGIMKMEAGLDTGPVFYEVACPIEPTDSAATLHDRLAVLGGQALVNALPGILSGQLAARAQSELGVTYAHKINKSEATINWDAPANVIANRIRAFDPFPGASTLWQGQVLKCWSAAVGEFLLNTPSAPGTVVKLGADYFAVAASGSTERGMPTVHISAAQLPGGKRLQGAAMMQALIQKGLTINTQFALTSPLE